ncbi:MAG: hypothetical protein ABSE35_21890 [Bryobacteraceae bacterium]|jgi:ABC-type antimicrobial peptide transport system permease subunit
MWLVLSETLWLTLAGIAAGVPLTLRAPRYATSDLFGIGPADPLTIATSAAALIGVGALAGYVPARRALRIDPVMAVRYE